MKKLLFTVCILLGLIFLSSTDLYAQDGFQLEAGAAYGLEAEAVGFQVGALYGFTQNIRGDANLTYFFPDSPDGVDNSLYEVNINGHYLFVDKEATAVYALAGLNLIRQEVSGGGYSVSGSETGLNIGGGAEFGVGFGGIYVEGKYALSSYDQFSLAAGVRFSL